MTTIQDIIRYAREYGKERFDADCQLLRIIMKAGEKDGRQVPAEFDAHPINIATKILFGYGKDTSHGIDAQLGATTDPDEIVKILGPNLTKESQTVRALVTAYLSAFKFDLITELASAPPEILAAYKPMLNAIQQRDSLI